MSVFGTYYALTPDAGESRFAQIHYVVTLATVVILTPGIAMAINGQGEILAKVGSLTALFSMGLFAFVVIRKGVGTSM
jgi:hypothetical protein